MESGRKAKTSLLQWQRKKILIHKLQLFNGFTSAFRKSIIPSIRCICTVHYSLVVWLAAVSSNKSLDNRNVLKPAFLKRFAGIGFNEKPGRLATRAGGLSGITIGWRIGIDPVVGHPLNELRVRNFVSSGRMESILGLPFFSIQTSR